MTDDVLVGVLNRNEKSVTSACLESIKKVTTYDNYNIVVVDNGSSDDSIQYLRNNFPTIELIKNKENKGVARGFNQILTKAASEGYEYIILLNNDINISQSTWIRKFLEVHQADPAISVVGCLNTKSDGTVDHGKQYVPPPIHSIKKYNSILNIHQKFRYNRYEHTNPQLSFDYADVVQGSAIMLNVEMAIEIKGFDELFSPIYWEDYDLCMRMWNAGYRVGYISDLEVIHDGPDIPEKSLARKYLLVRNSIRFMIIHYPVSWLPVTFFGLVINSIFLIFRSPSERTSWINPVSIHNLIIKIITFLKCYFANIRILADLISRRARITNAKYLLK